MRKQGFEARRKSAEKSGDKPVVLTAKQRLKAQEKQKKIREKKVKIAERNAAKAAEEVEIADADLATDLDVSADLDAIDKRLARLEKREMKFTDKIGDTPDEPEEKADKPASKETPADEAEDERVDPKEATESGTEVPRGFNQVALRLAKSLLAEPLNESDPPVTKVKKQFAFGALKVLTSFVGADWIKGLSTDPNEAKRKSEIDSALDDLESGYAMKVIDRAAIYSDDPNVFIKVEWGEAEKTANIYPRSVSNIMRRTLGGGNIDANLKKLGIDVTEKDKKWTVEAMQEVIKGNTTQPAKNLAILLTIIEKSRQGSKTAEVLPWLNTNALFVTRQLGKHPKGFKGYMEAVEEPEVSEELDALNKAAKAFNENPNSEEHFKAFATLLFPYIKNMADNVPPVFATAEMHVAKATLGQFESLEAMETFYKAVEQKGRELFPVERDGSDKAYELFRKEDLFMQLVYIGAQEGGADSVDLHTYLDGSEPKLLLLANMYDEDFASKGLAVIKETNPELIPEGLNGEDLETALDDLRLIIPVQSEYEYTFDKNTLYADAIEEVRSDYAKIGKADTDAFASFMSDKKPDRGQLKAQLAKHKLFLKEVGGLPDEISAAFDDPSDGNLDAILNEYERIQDQMNTAMEGVKFHEQLTNSDQTDSDFVEIMMDVAEVNSRK